MVTFLNQKLFASQDKVFAPKALFAKGALGLALICAPLYSSLAVAFDHSHQKWNAILQSHVSSPDGGKSTSFAYGRVKKDEAPLKSYLSDLSQVKKSEYEKFSEPEKMAFLINAYNAFIVKLIVDNYPIDSIKKIGIPFVGPWKKSYIPLLGSNLSPDNIEHGMLRKDFKEPRIHMGVNCASISCPPLRNEAFVAARLDAQLNEQANLFFQNEKQTRYVEAEKKLYLNSILSWFSEDFSQNGKKGLPQYVANYNPAVKKALSAGTTIDVEFLDYDWGLNDAK